MKRILLLAAALILSAGLYAQSFQFNLNESVDGCIVSYTGGVMESDDGSLFMSVELVKNYTKFHRIMEMTRDGEIIESKYIDVKGNCTGFFPFFRHPKQKATNVFVYFVHGNPTTFNAIWFDNNLNIRREICTTLPYSNNNRDIIFSGAASCILDSENNIVIMKRVDETNNFICLKLDLAGNIIMEKEITIDANFHRQQLYNALTVYNENPLQYAFSFVNNIGYSLNRIGTAILDSEFNIIDENHCIVPDLHSEQRTNVVGYDNDSYLISTNDMNYGYGIPGISQSINLRKMDKNHNIINEYKHEFSLNSPHPYLCEKNIVVDKDGGIYWIYLLPNDASVNPDDPYAFGKHDLYISYFDSDLNLIWERMVKDFLNQYTGIMSATLCDNGDLALTGSDFINKYLFTMVMDKDGKPLNVEESLVRPYSFYPNPADDAISLRFSPDVNCEKVEIYSLDGKLCLSQNFNFNTIDINSLSSGIYMMKVSLSNGNVYTEKVVKK